MEIDVYPTAAGMLAEIRPYLESCEAQNNLILGVSQALAELPAQQPGDYFFSSLRVDDAPVLVAMVTPEPYGLMLFSHLQRPAAAIALTTETLRARKITLYGIHGERNLADQFAQSWIQATGLRERLLVDMSTYRLDRVRPPRPAAGHLRLAGEFDKAVVDRFARAFTAEALGQDEDQAAQIMLERVDQDQVYLWEDEGRVTCMAAWNRPTRRGVAVNQVYTPPQWRRRGYAINAVAQLSSLLLARGRGFCCLFTDKANPTSNSIYQQIGYRHIGDCRHYRFI